MEKGDYIFVKKIVLFCSIFVLFVGMALAEYPFDEEINMHEKDIHNVTHVNATHLQGDLESEYIKSPPAAPAAGYAMSHFNDNFSTVTVDFFNINSDKWLGDFDAMGHSLINATNVNVTGDLNVEGIIYSDCWVSREPFLDENTANVANKPTLVSRGLFQGYSLPEYTGGEELYFRTRVPHRWDGSTNPWFVAITSISANEGVGDKYKFNLSWVSEDIEHIIPDNTCETITCEVTVANGSAYYAEIISFELDATTIVAGQNLQARLRRVPASSSSVSNEVVVWHWDIRWLFEKLGSNSTQGYDG